MDLTKIPTQKLEKLLKKIKATRQKHPAGQGRWWFWFRVQQRAQIEMSRRYETFMQYRKRKEIKNVSIGQGKLID